jgi:hypothetical protein
MTDETTDISQKKLRTSIIAGIIGLAFALVSLVLVLCDVLLYWLFILSFLVPLITGIVGVVKVRGARRLGTKSRFTVIALALSLVDIVLGMMWLAVDIYILAAVLSMIATFGA